MSDTNTAQASGGIGFGGLLTIVFITLKLTGYIDWSWWWVLSPIWLPIAIFLGIFGVILAFLGLSEVVSHRKNFK